MSINKTNCQTKVICARALSLTEKGLSYAPLLRSMPMEDDFIFCGTRVAESPPLGGLAGRHGDLISVAT